MLKTDVLFIKPDFKDIAIIPPLGLGYLASSLSKHGISSLIHDNTLLMYNDDELADLIKKASPRIIGLSVVTPMIRRAREIAALAKKVDKKIFVVMGGPHPSYTVEDTLGYNPVDAVVIGEGEETFVEVAKNILKGEMDLSGIQGCAFRKGTEIIQSSPRKMIEDLDSLPFPDLDNMPIETYFRKNVGYGVLQKRKRNIPIIASRGCPSTCTFCLRFMGKKFRIRSAENIVDELIYRKNKYGVTDFNFLDDNFTLHKKRVLEVCDYIHKKDLKIKFRFPNGVREDYLDEEILAALKSVGCYHLDFGIESGSQKVLDIMKKRKKVEKIAEKVYLCKRNGFKLSATFLFGTPGETLEDMEESIRFAKSLPLDSASFGIVTPYPGTELRKEVIEKGYLAHDDYDLYNPCIDNFKPPIQTPDWSGEDLLRMQKRAHREFYIRPKQAIKMIPTMANLTTIRLYAEYLYHIFFKNK